MTLPNLPVETWQQILQEAISLPTFLDPDCLPEVTNPLYTSYPDLDINYWETEGLRNTLQCVCKSWDTYLRPFSHRFVRLFDVCHGNISKDALRKAIRFAPQRCGILDCHHCGEDNQITDICNLIAETGELSVKIIEPGSSPENLAHIVIQTYTCMPQLQVIIDARVEDRDFNNWKNTISSLLELKFVHFTHNGRQPLALQAVNLTTLSYESEKGPFRPLLDEGNLPSLRHLRLKFSWPNAASEIGRIISLLERIGRNLLSLQIVTYHSRQVIPEGIWESCPRLQRLDSSLCFRHPPPPNHPLHTISIFLPFTQIIGGDHRSISAFPTSLADWVSLQRVIVSESWHRLRPSTSLRTLRHIRRWVDVCKECNVILIDSEDVLFEKSGIGAYLH